MPYLSPGVLRHYGYNSYDADGRQSVALPLPMVFEAAEQPKWEYRTITIDPREEAPLDDDRLNELGAEGWLLAGIAQFPGGERVTRIIYCFVRSA